MDKKDNMDKNKQKGSMVWGVFLIVIGVLFLIGNISRMGMEELWPMFPMAAGLAFIVGYIRDRKNYGLLMPGSILVVISGLFLFCSIFGWWHMESLWPVFILAPAAGFLAMYWGGSRENGLLISASVLGTVGIVFLFVSSGLGDWWPVFLVAAGLIMILTEFVGKKKKA